jgi:hypothetical protein
MSSLSNRRFTPRFNLKIPFVFCPMNTPLERGQAAKSINISERGVYFKTKYPVFVGLPVRVLLQMPTQCGGNPSTRVIFTGRVSHVTESGPHPSLGVGVEFFYRETLDR